MRQAHVGLVNGRVGVWQRVWTPFSVTGLRDHDWAAREGRAATDAVWMHSDRAGWQKRLKGVGGR